MDRRYRRGELSEWSKEPHSKCGIRITSYRGFESLTLRKEKGRFVCLSLLKQANRSFFFEQGASGSLLGFEVGLPQAMSVSSNPCESLLSPRSVGSYLG